MDIERLVQRIRQTVRALAHQSLPAHATQASTDAEQFLQQLEPELERWASLLADGYINNDEFVSLVQGRRVLAKMSALKQAGLAQVQIENFKNGILEIVVREMFTGTDSPGPQFRP